MRLGREAMGEVCVSATGLTGAAGEVVAVDRGDDVGLTGGGAASLASMMYT